jgi:hypothetical protein
LGQTQTLIDLNGDGLPDIYNATTGQAWLNTGSGFASTPIPWAPPAAAGGYIRRGDPTGQYQGLIDLNGDGLPDYFNAQTAQVWLNSGSGFAATPIAWNFPNVGPGAYVRITETAGKYTSMLDMNGDGLPDIYAASSGQVWFNTGAGFTSTLTPWLVPTAAASVYAGASSGGATPSYTCPPGGSIPVPEWGVCLDSQERTWPPTSITYSCPAGYKFNVSKCEFGQVSNLQDFNGDGLPDLFQATTSQVWLNTGSGFATPPRARMTCYTYP